MGHLAARMQDLDRTRPVYVICATGNRSRAMTDLLRVPVSTPTP
jgi:rhodanese-related sulfurtransferase